MKKKQKKKVSINPQGVSTKNYKPSAKVGGAARKAAVYNHKDERTMIAVIAVSTLLLAAIIVGLVFLIINQRDMNRRVDFMKDDLSEFVTIDRNEYAGYTVTVEVPEISDTDVENKILQLLKQKKGELICEKDYANGVHGSATDPEKDGICADHSSHSLLQAGDIAYIWYRGYELDENGNRTKPSGTCNFYGTSPKDLELGSGSFIAGFELGLIGKTAGDSSYFYKKTTGDILDTDIVYLTGTCSQEVGDFYYSANIRIDLADPDVEKIWGVGIADYLKNIGIGGSSKDVTELTTTDGNSVVFSDVEVKFTTTHKAEETPITVKTVFPYNYQTESFRNKTIYFEVYIDRTVHYEAAEYNDALIESMGFGGDKLADFEGDTLTDKYTARIRYMLEAERQSAIRGLAQEALWDNILKKAVFHKLPNGDVQDAFDLFYSQFKIEYENSESEESLMGGFQSVGDYIAARLGLNPGEDWRAKLTEIVEDDIKERLVFMRVLQQENLMPTAEEFEAEYRKTVESEYEKNYGKTRKDFATDELYQSALKNFEERMKLGSGETYFSDKVYFNLSIDGVIDMMNIVNKADNK